MTIAHTIPASALRDGDRFALIPGGDVHMAAVNMATMGTISCYTSGRKSSRGMTYRVDVMPDQPVYPASAAGSGTWQVETAQPAPADLAAAVEVIPWDACICEGRVTRPRGDCWASTHNLRTAR